MRAVITVTGKDRTGIIAKISATLYEHQVNIVDISQNVMEDMFAMVMLVNIDKCTVDFLAGYCDYCAHNSSSILRICEFFADELESQVAASVIMLMMLFETRKPASVKCQRVPFSSVRPGFASARNAAS